MERILVVSFDNERDAYLASDALDALGEEDVIAFIAGGVVARNADGATTIVRTHDDDPEATMGGTAIGLLLGLAGGPVGLAAGAATGFAIGAAADLKRARITDHFVTEVVDALERGHAALVADIDEESTDAVDARMKELGGRVARHDPTELADRDYERRRKER